MSRGTTRRLFFFTARSLVDDAARCHCRIRPVHFRVRGEEKAYSRTTAGTVSNNVRCTTYRLEKSSRTCFTCPVIEIQGGATNSLHISRDNLGHFFSLQTCLKSTDVIACPSSRKPPTPSPTLRSVSYLRASHHYE